MVAETSVTSKRDHMGLNTLTGTVCMSHGFCSMLKGSLNATTDPNFEQNVVVICN